jgi:hypothetical protein
MCPKYYCTPRSKLAAFFVYDKRKHNQNLQERNQEPAISQRRHRFDTTLFIMYFNVFNILYLYVYSNTQLLISQQPYMKEFAIIILILCILMD